MTHIHRFFLTHQIISGERTMLAADDVFHAGRVLRLKPDDDVELVGADGIVFRGRVVAVDGGIEVVAGEVVDGGTEATGLTVVQALPRGRKLDLVVEKLSELGVERLVPVWTDKSVAPPGKSGEKMKRWRRIARSSAAQSKRSAPLEVDEPVALIEWLAAVTVPVIVLSTENRPEPLGATITRIRPPLALVIGPEAGFSDEEIGSLSDSGAAFGSLGDLVLRTETAALVAATVVLHHMGKIG